jgi:hypothetical protein
MSAHDADLTLKQIVEVCGKAVELRIKKQFIADSQSYWSRK